MYYTTALWLSQKAEAEDDLAEMLSEPGSLLRSRGCKHIPPVIPISLYLCYLMPRMSKACGGVHMANAKLTTGVWRGTFVALFALVALIAVLVQRTLPQQRYGQSVGAISHATPVATATPTAPRTREELAATLLTAVRRNPGRVVWATAPSLWLQIRDPRAESHEQTRPCHVLEGERIEFVRMRGDYLELRYSPLRTPGGAECPAGTLFSIPADGTRN
jgi:hypothetical protein